ncbi:hypothetical protein GCM10010911_35870 [Paenibacillus nasutitermitis]|uniref:Uncharacterized protein n=1 Tax=Paenibacillus nasutitermitis TaxID=1652958 RepID=A0A916Z3P6_9BACL|nr:hypothetical protein GCM10010911_35870 [Paenibacillus nasutitermitis]
MRYADHSNLGRSYFVKDGIGRYGWLYRKQICAVPVPVINAVARRPRVAFHMR